MEWVEGWSVREVLGGGAEGEEEEEEEGGELEMTEMEGTRTPAEEVMEQLGLSVGELRRSSGRKRRLQAYGPVPRYTQPN
jgi:hypothetical protein